MTEMTEGTHTLPFTVFKHWAEFEPSPQNGTQVLYKPITDSMELPILFLCIFFEFIFFGPYRTSYD
jgi:hypothetical protein